MNRKIGFVSLVLTPYFDGPDELGEFQSDLATLDGGEDDNTDNEDTDTDNDGEDAPEETGDDSVDDGNEPEEGKDDKKKSKKEKEVDTEDEPEEDDAEQDDEEDDEPEEDKVDGRPTIKAIKTKYPNLFKDFPDLRHAFFREREFSKVFGTVEDAEDASFKANVLDNFTEAINTGTIGPVLEGIEQEMGKDGLNTFIDSFMPALFERDPRLYVKVTEPVLKNAIRAIYNHGVKNKSQNHVLAARYFSHYLFENPDVEAATKIDSNTNTSRGNPKEQEFIAKQQQAAQQSVDTNIIRRVKSRVFKAIDPDGKMPELHREAIADRAVKELDNILAQDKAYRAQLKSLWKRAGQSGYVGEALTKVENAFLARASQSLPSVLNKLRAIPVNKKQQKKKLPDGKERHGESRNIDKNRSVDYRKTSDRDILDGKVTYKGDKKR
jgi:hypothetical protein